MRQEKDIRTAEMYKILDKVRALEDDLMKIQGVTEVEFEQANTVLQRLRILLKITVSTCTGYFIMIRAG